MAINERKILRCAVYTRKSSEHGLDQDFNSLHAQREAAEAYIKSQAHEGWTLVKAGYDDGGLSGGTLERPTLQRLLADMRNRKIDIVVVYKVDRLTRSLADFAKLVELFEAHGASFVAVTQQFNTTTSMGRLTLNVLLSFAQFERELAGERIRDKVLASRRKGMWMGGTIPLGYDVKDRKLVVNLEEAERVRLIFRRYLELGCVSGLQEDLRQHGVRSKRRILTSGQALGGGIFGRGQLYHLLQNRLYLGEAVHKGLSYPGEHERIIEDQLWNAVQAMLAENRGTRRRGRIESGALLGGLLFDDQGNRMSPTYAIRRSMRHRYYVSRGLIGGSEAKPGSRARVAAEGLERIVVDVLARQLGRVDLLRDAPHESWSVEIRGLVRETVERIVVQSSEVQIICKAGIASTLSQVPGDDDGRKLYSVPLAPPSPRARREIILPSAGDAKPRRISHDLMLAIARANRWMHDLSIGACADTAEIALRHGVNEAHVRRLLRLNYLAPDIIEAIVEGRQPRALTVRRLMRSIPCVWDEQRAIFGFALRMAI